ncbi:MAG: glutathione S-transferase family protein [Myxococcota bacterium]
MTVTIHGFAPSTYVRTARLVCEEKGIAYTLSPVEFGSDAHRALHPYARIPAMTHGKVTLFETLAIGSYLNEEFGGQDLEGQGAVERARMLGWASAAIDYLAPAVVRPFIRPETIDPDAVKTATVALGPVDAALGQARFLAGDQLTLADLFVLPQILHAEKTIGHDEWVRPLENVCRWKRVLQDRPSVTATEAGG